MQEQKPQKPIVIEIDGTPISTMLEALHRLGYDYESSGIQCLEDEDIQEEMEQGGVWLVAPDQGPCSEGEAYKLQITPERVDEVKAAIRMIEALYDYLYITAPKEYSLSSVLEEIINCINDELTYADFEDSEE